MSDLILSGGGLTSVGTDEMLEHERVLSQLAGHLDEWIATMLSPAVVPARHSPQWRSGDPEAYLLWARTALREAQQLAASLATSLGEAAEGYGRAERAVQRLSTTASAVLGWIFGFAAPVEILAFVVAVLGAGAGFGALTALTGSPRSSLEALVAGARHSGLLSSPLFVATVRGAVSSVDDAMLGAAWVPLPVTLALDDDATGWFGLATAAGIVVGLAGPRLLKETPVDVARVAGPTARGPTGFVDLAERIPPSGVGKPQVRIERYPGRDSPRWIVYAGGTVDTGIRPAGEPWDDTSNVQGIAQLDPGSSRATLAALREAGARPGDPVLCVGYSQGGIVATDVVRDGGFANAGLVTFGSPTAQMQVPADVPNVAVEVTEDLIPALGGEPRDAAHGGLQRVLVRRGIYDAGHPPPSTEMLPAHALDNYAQTARLMDASGDPRLTGMRQRIDEFTRGAVPEVSLWRADRVSLPPVAVPAGGAAPGGTPTSASADARADR